MSFPLKPNGRTYLYKDKIGLSYLVQADSFKHAKSILFLKTPLCKEQLDVPHAVRITSYIDLPIGTVLQVRID